MSDFTLKYPAQIAKEIGLGVNEMNALKTRGCPFYGRKTSVVIVRAFIHKIMGAEFLLAPSLHLQRLGGNISDEQADSNGSLSALPGLQTILRDDSE